MTRRQFDRYLTIHIIARVLAEDGQIVCRTDSES